MYVCRGKAAGKPKGVNSVMDCMRYCKETPACEFYGWSTDHNWCYLYEECDRKESYAKGASGSMAECSKGYHGM